MSKKPLNVYFIRHNFKDLNDGNQIIEELFSKQEIAIRLQTKEDIDSWKKTKNQFKNCKIPVVREWRKIEKICTDNDILIIAKYFNNPKILVGIIKKGAKTIEKEQSQSFFKIFKLKDVMYFTEDDKHKFFSTIIPAKTAISNIETKKEIVNNIYFNDLTKFNVDFLTDTHVEQLCNDWLKLKYYKEFDRYIFPLGGHIQYLDCLFRLYDKTIISSQITTSSRSHTLNSKATNLLKISADEHYLFGKSKNFKAEKIKYISIYEVWNKMSKISNYIEALKVEVIQFYSSIQENQIDNETADYGLPTADQTKTTNA